MTLIGMEANLKAEKKLRLNPTMVRLKVKLKAEEEEFVI